jgi:FkbM family methyltransferase
MKSKQAKQVLVNTLRLAIVAVALLTAGFCMFAYWPPFRAFALVTTGRAGNCPFDEAVKARENNLLHERLIREISGSLAVVEEDRHGFQLWQTPRGAYWMPKSDKELLAHLLAEQRREIYGDGRRGVQAGDVVIDCGAHVGVFTRAALQRGAKQVIAVEPAPENIESLKRNFSPEIKAGRVIIYPKGVWDRDDILRIKTYPGNSARDSFVADWQKSHLGTAVPLTTIDKLVSELNLERIDFIKMDIEGAERKALIGASNTLRKNRPRLAIASYHVPDDPIELPAGVFAAVKDYRLTCGPCEDHGGRIVPAVLYFE